MTRPARISFFILVLLALLTAWLHLGTLVLATLFGFLALRVFTFSQRRTLAVVLYLVLVLVIAFGLAYCSSLAIRTLPRIAETSIPAMVEFAEQHGIQLPFTDFASLKSTALDSAQEGIATIGQYASVASLQFVLLLAGIVVALSLFLNPTWTAEPMLFDSPAQRLPDNLYTAVTGELSLRFRLFFESFAKVIGAQLLISSINTVLTAIFLLANGYPYIPLLLMLVFLCGLLPIVGNLISNSLIVGVGFTLSPRTGLIALAFLVVIHKLEYFLDSKIIGKRINSPMWLTMIGLVLGERLMGIPGMILAPVLLRYIKVEVSAYRANPVADPAANPTQLPPAES